MREHTHLPAMVGFVRKHVAQHFRANRPWLRPTVSAKLLDAAPRTAERFREHLRAASGALGQSRTGLPRRAMRAVKLSWNLQVWSGKPNPLGANVVHVREDGRNGAHVAGRFGSPGARVKVFDKNLVDAVVGGKDTDCGLAELSVNSMLTRGHSSLSFACATTSKPSIWLLGRFYLGYERSKAQEPSSEGAEDQAEACVYQKWLRTTRAGINGFGNNMAVVQQVDKVPRPKPGARVITHSFIP